MTITRVMWKLQTFAIRRTWKPKCIERMDLNSFKEGFGVGWGWGWKGGDGGGPMRGTHLFMRLSPSAPRRRHRSTTHNTQDGIFRQHNGNTRIQYFQFLEIVRHQPKRYCYFTATVTCSVMDENLNFQWLDLKIRHRIYKNVSVFDTSP